MRLITVNDSDFFIELKFELLVALILFILLFLKLGNKEWKNESLSGLVNFLLLINFVFGFFMNHGGELFMAMFRTNRVIELEKNILNLGTLIISSAGIYLVEESQTRSGILYADALHAAWNVFYDLQRQPPNVLFWIGIVNHTACSDL